MNRVGPTDSEGEGRRKRGRTVKKELTIQKWKAAL